MRMLRIGVVALGVLSIGGGTAANQPVPIGWFCVIPHDPASEHAAREECVALAESRGYAHGVLRAPVRGDDSPGPHCPGVHEVVYTCYGVGGGRP